MKYVFYFKNLQKNPLHSGWKGNPYTLLVGMQISEDTMEISVEVLQ
jgi:hypothetical protein